MLEQPFDFFKSSRPIVHSAFICLYQTLASHRPVGPFDLAEAAEWVVWILLAKKQDYQNVHYRHLSPQCDGSACRVLIACNFVPDVNILCLASQWNWTDFVYKCENEWDALCRPNPPLNTSNFTTFVNTPDSHGLYCKWGFRGLKNNIDWFENGLDNDRVGQGSHLGPNCRLYWALVRN